ncbi:thiosulfate sulfurtransferase GlpE [Methylococcus sp. EFPC2]|uniref:thiosulfate sulfurtransferase GlpE n=1 Tax=Methylococcus sp. EFPC2 TaxID=2812648 RepID=UPI001968A47D|nr:thiosulfate sulfurtransferase GlpE [Methylococcus sp. EFPC2]QSA99270.1 thiosulfate sulfurtransferase GlpE [Methylococcus sp. EFPC2]
MSVASGWRRIEISELPQLLERDDLTIFDMRDEFSYQQEHMGGARYLSNANLEEMIMKTPRDKPVLIYCYHGNASQSGARIFADFGFREVYDLIGGYEGLRTALAAAAAEPAYA